MQSSTYQRVLALSGVLFVALIVAALAITPNQVDESASVAKAFDYWNDHQTAEIVSAFLVHLAAVALVFFGAGLRSVLRGGEGEESTYSVIAFGGAVFAAVGFVLAAWVSLAAATAADQGSREAVYTLTQLNAVNWIPFTAGLSVMMLAAGIGGLRTVALPKVASWVAIVLGIGFLTPVGPAGFLVLPFWVIAVSVILYRAQREPAATGSAPASSVA
jgi:hypothetical protein